MNYIERLATLDEAGRREWFDTLSEEEKRRVAQDFWDWNRFYARESQRPPLGDWTTWVINAGRGFGKTRSGAEWIRQRAEGGARRIALVGRTAADVRDVMIEGESGILAVSPPWARPHYVPSRRRLEWSWPNGTRTVAHTYTAEKPDMLRGPQFDTAWCDELASWKYSDAFSNLQLGLREGPDPRVCITTTPKPRAFFRRLLGELGTVVTGGSTFENRANLPEKFFRDITSQYEGTRTGRQELYAVIMDQAENALWTRAMIDDHRINHAPTDLERIVVAIDPAATSSEHSNETGIVCAGVLKVVNAGRMIDHFYVLDDASGRMTPLSWAKRAIDLGEARESDRIVGEKNNGGEMVETTLRTVDRDVPYKAVHASRGKQARAEPIAALYEQGRVHHVGEFDDLEDQLCNWEPTSGAASPDRLDALVWAITELKQGRGVLQDLSQIGGFGEADQASHWNMGS